MDNIEKLQQLKQLLDEGILTQEEFDSRKEQILFPEKIEEERRKEEEEKRKQEEASQKNVLFDTAISRFDVKTSESYKQGISGLEELGDWRDANVLVEKYKAELVEIEKKEEEEEAEKKKESLYENALKKFEVRTSSSYRSAIADLESLGEWKDAIEIIEERKPELQEILEEEQKKSKQLKKKLVIAAVAVVVVIVAVAVAKMLLTPNLAKFTPTKEKTINTITFKVPEECKAEVTSATCTTLSLSKNNQIIGVIEVQYKGDSDLEGTGGYNSKTDEHKPTDKAKELIPDGSGEYKMVEADNSAYEVAVYSSEKVNGKSDLLNAIAESFDTSGYKNPRESEGLQASYNGDASAGVKIDTNTKGLSVYEKYKNAKGVGTKGVTFTVTEPVTLEAGETSTVKINANGQECELKITCSDKGAFYKDGAFTASMDDIMADYKKNYSSVHAYSGTTVSGGSVSITKKDNTYGGQFNCTATNHKFVITFTGMDASGDKEKAASEIPDDLIILIMTNGDEESEDLMCIVSLLGNMLANLNPEIKQNEAYNDVLEGMQSATGSSVASTSRTYGGIPYTIAYTSKLYTMKIGE